MPKWNIDKERQRIEKALGSRIHIGLRLADLTNLTELGLKGDSADPDRVYDVVRVRFGGGVPKEYENHYALTYYEAFLKARKAVKKILRLRAKADQVLLQALREQKHQDVSMSCAAGSALAVVVEVPSEG